MATRGSAGRGGGGRPAHQLGGRELDPGIPQPLGDLDRQGVSGLFVDLGGALRGERRGADEAPAVGFERGAKRGGQAHGFDAALVDETRGFYAGGFDDGGLAGVEGEAFRNRDILELAPDRPGSAGASRDHGDKGNPNEPPEPEPAPDTSARHHPAPDWPTCCWSREKRTTTSSDRPKEFSPPRKPPAHRPVV